MLPYIVTIPYVSLGVFFFVLCKENLEPSSGAVVFDIQRGLFNLIVNLAISLSLICISFWADGGGLFSSLICAWAALMLYVGYMVCFENKVAAAMLKRRTEIIAKAQAERGRKKK